MKTATTRSRVRGNRQHFDVEISLSLRQSWSDLSKKHSFGATNEEFSLWRNCATAWMRKRNMNIWYPTSRLSGANNHCKKIPELTPPALALRRSDFRPTSNK